MHVACGLRSTHSPASLRAGLHVDTLYRVMRAAVNMKLLTAAPGARGQPPRFANAALGDVLRDDHPNNAWPMVRGRQRRALVVLVKQRALCSRGNVLMGAGLVAQIQWTVDDGYPTLAALEPAIRTGKNTFRMTHEGQSLWELLKVRGRPVESALWRPVALCGALGRTGRPCCTQAGMML